MSAGDGVSVLLVGNFLHATTGTYGVCEELARQLQGRGWTVLTTSSERRPLARLVDMLRTIWMQRSEYTVAQVDVYSGRAFLWAQSVCWALQRVKRPFILTLHGGALPIFAKRRPDRIRALLGSAAAVTTPSSYLLQEMAEYRSDLRLHPNPVAITQYQFRVRRTPAPRLLWLRAFHDVYNPIMALRALDLLRRDHPAAHLTLAGPDRHDGTLDKVHAVVAELGLRAHVRFTGPVPKADVPSLLAEADIFLNTSNIDNTPVSVLEAQASGLCIVSTDVGGIPHMVENGRNALLVPAGDAAAMAAAIRRILEEPGVAEQLSIQGRDNARARDCSVVVPKWEQLFREIAAGEPARSNR
jgi:glycosyltransferase involved in cell wall biosynthesis